MSAGLPHRLPRAVEEDPRAATLLRRLGECSRPIRHGSRLSIPFVAFDPRLVDSLKSAQTAGRIVRGLEAAERVLDAEANGMRQVDRASGVERGVRVSRVLLVSHDGGDSFYRQVHKLLERHGERVLAICIQTDAATLGAPLFGAGRTTRLLMISHKEAVAVVLLALAELLEHSDS